MLTLTKTPAMLYRTDTTPTPHPTSRATKAMPVEAQRPEDGNGNRRPKPRSNRYQDDEIVASFRLQKPNRKS